MRLARDAARSTRRETFQVLHLRRRMDDLVRQLSMNELEAGLDIIRNSPRDHGILELIVIRPAIDQRQTPTEAQLDIAVGLVGDNWLTRGSNKTADGSAHPDKQLT